MKEKSHLFLLPLLIGFQAVYAANPPAPLNVTSSQSGYRSFEWVNSFEWVSEPLSDNGLGGEYRYDRAHIPPLRYTDDSRVGVYGIGLIDSAGDTPGESGFRFNIIRPEAINTAHHSVSYDDRKGFVGQWTTVTSADIRNELDRFDLLKDYGSYRTGSHIGLCDPTQFIEDDFNSNERRNPYRCGENDDEECYSVKLIGSLHKEDYDFSAMNLYSLPVTIKVSNPKTKDAAISEIDFTPEEAKISDKSFTARRVFEPIVAGDGRLLVFRVAGKSHNNHEFDDGDIKVSVNDVDIVYSVYDDVDDDDNPTAVCDVNGWDQYYPITFAHHDDSNRMKDRYKFAYEPMRDPSGNPYDKYQDTGATYPWIDKDAANLAFTIINQNSNLTSNGVIRYNGSCTGGGGGGLSDNKCDEDGLFGVAVNGMWTRWKTILLDGVANPADFGLHWDRRDAVDFQFYNDTGRTRVSGVRAVESEQNFESFESGFPTNTTIIESIENTLNYVPEMAPQTPRDTVWKFGNSLVTTELAFDDYINDDFLINASMTGLVAYLGEDTRKSPIIPRSRYFDGFYSSAEHTGVLTTQQRCKYFSDSSSCSNGTEKRAELQYLATGTFEATEPILFQNSATHKTAPSFGILDGVGRVEPIAAGGIFGKGLYLKGNSRLRFELERNVFDANPDMYIGLFINQRQIVDNVWRPLFKFADNTQVYIYRTGEEIRLSVRNFNSGDGVVTPKIQNITLPAFQSKSDNVVNNWLHIGLEALNKIGSQSSNLNVYQNGNLAGTLEFLNQKIFRPVDGSVSLGNFDGHTASGSINAWFDEFKVKEIADGLTLNKEEICNHARGTFVYAPKHSVLRSYASKFDEDRQEELNDIARTNNAQFLCLVNYVEFENSKFSELSTAKPINGHTSLMQAEDLGTPARALLTHPDSLSQDPNSIRRATLDNDFCLSCHNYPEDELIKSLSKSALAASTVHFKVGPRQPSQPPALISGLVPESLSNPARWISQVFDPDGNVTRNYEFVDDIIADPTPPSPPKSKVVFVRYKSYLIPIATD